MDTATILENAFKSLGYSSSSFFVGTDQKKYISIHKDNEDLSWNFSPSGPLYPFMSASSRTIAGDKTRSYDFAVLNNVMIPTSIYIDKDDTTYQAAIELLSQHKRVIVKPTNQALSYGVTLDITDIDHLKKAISFARTFSPIIIVQQQVFGDEIRFAVVDGKVRAAILRQTARVIGDGTKSIRQLIDVENKLRKSIKNTAVPYPELDGSLISLDENTLATIPNNGEIVELNRNTMVKDGASIYNITESVNDSYIQTAERLGRKLGRGFVVVDMIVADYTKPADETNYAFLEFNLAPALALFYSCRDGKHFTVAEDYLAPMIDKLLKEDYV